MMETENGPRWSGSRCVCDMGGDAWRQGRHKGSSLGRRWEEDGFAYEELTRGA